MHLYTKRPKFYEAKKVHFGLTYGACNIASVSYTSACTTMWGNTVYIRTDTNKEWIFTIHIKIVFSWNNPFHKNRPASSFGINSWKNRENGVYKGKFKKYIRSKKSAWSKEPRGLFLHMFICFFLCPCEKMYICSNKCLEQIAAIAEKQVYYKKLDVQFDT